MVGTQKDMVAATYRSQWSGVNGGPKTATVYGSFNIEKMGAGVGGYIFNDVSGNISILNNFATGNINLAAGGSSTAQATLASTGNLLLGTTTDVASSKLTVTSTTSDSISVAAAAVKLGPTVILTVFDVETPTRATVERAD